MAPQRITALLKQGVKFAFATEIEIMFRNLSSLSYLNLQRRYSPTEVRLKTVFVHSTCAATQASTGSGEQANGFVRLIVYITRVALTPLKAAGSRNRLDRPGFEAPTRPPLPDQVPDIHGPSQPTEGGQRH